MAFFHNKNHGIKLPIIEGKFYVVDTFSGPMSGPFDTCDQADESRSGMAIEDDCSIGECKAIDANDNRYILTGYQFRAMQELAEYSCETCGSDTDEPTITCEGCSEGND